MKVNTDNYREEHGQNPRPSQTGLWVFSIGGRPGEYTEFKYRGSYRTAVHEAKAEAKLIGRASSITLSAHI
jgi:hypothetical protein